MISDTDINEIFTEEDDSEPSQGVNSRFMFFGILGLCATAGLGLINTLFIGWLAVKPPPTLVRDTVEGTAFRVKKANDPVTAEQVLMFASRCMNQLHTWTGMVESSKYPGLMEVDPGVLVSDGGNSRRLTTQAFEASFCLNQSIREPFVQVLANQTPQAVFANDPQNVGGGTYVLLNARNWLGPEKLPDGRWKITIIADITGYSPESPGGRPIAKLNKDIYIKEVPKIPLLYSEVIYQKLAYINRAEGLEIDAIVNTEMEEIRAPR